MDDRSPRRPLLSPPHRPARLRSVRSGAARTVGRCPRNEPAQFPHPTTRRRRRPGRPVGSRGDACEPARFSTRNPASSCGEADGGRGGEREPVKVCTVARAKFLDFFEPCVPHRIWSLPCAHGRTQRPLGNQKLRPQRQSLKGGATPNFTCSPPTGSSTSLLPKPARNSPSRFSAATAASRKSSGEGGVPESRLELRLY